MTDNNDTEPFKAGMTGFRTNRPKELVKFSKKRRGRNW